MEDPLTLILLAHRKIVHVAAYVELPHEKYSTTLFHLQSSDTIYKRGMLQLCLRA